MRALFAALVVIIAALVSPASAQNETSGVRLYAIDCGRLDWKDMGAFSDTGEHAGETGTMAAPCFLIRHGKDWMLWDTGLGDRLSALPHGETLYGGRFTVRRTLKSQLAQLGLTPDDVHYVALSHLHADHSGNIGLFPRSTFLIATSELAWARGTPTPVGVQRTLIAPLDRDHIVATDDDRDVFGDGTVRILKAPGHTPGHRILFLRLAITGPVLVSGDLFHTRENYEKGLVPEGNVNRADTLASIARFRRIAANTHARVIIQHSAADFQALPAFPNYLK